MAFLQRVTNDGGHIDREYAAGRGQSMKQAKLLCWDVETKAAFAEEETALIDTTQDM
jgi:hypothetical protein